MMSVEESRAVEHFSLVKGGPFYRLMTRIGMVRPEDGRYIKEAWSLGLVAWLPLVMLAAAEGSLAGGRVRIPLLNDYAATIRFLIAIPLLVAVEPVIDRWLNSTVRQFIAQNLVPESETPRFNLAAEQAQKTADSLWTEIVLIGAAYTFAYFALVGWLASPFPTWHTSFNASGQHPTLPGWWYALVSIPLWNFLLFRWAWRLVIWYRFLLQVSRLDLKLLPINPDLAGGLGFLKFAQASFSLVAFALSSVVVALLANRIAYLGHDLSTAYLPMTGMVLGTLLILLLPLLFFTPKLIEAKKYGIYRYGVLADDYVHRFDAKWIKHEAAEDEELLGTSDIQSLADLANSFNIIQRMKVVPFDLNTIIAITLVTLIPLLPLVVGVLPFDEIFESVLRVLV